MTSPPPSLFFYQDPYATSLDQGTITLVDTEKHALQLDIALFFPAGGGQPGDKGSLTSSQGQNIRILNTLKGSEPHSSLLFLHPDDTLPSLGDTVSQHIDWNFRKAVMAMHTSLHLLCAALPFGVTGGSISPEKSRLDFDTMGEPMPTKDTISEKLNRFILENLSVSSLYTDWNFLDDNPHIVRTQSVQPPRTSDTLRLVRIGDENAPLDIQPCGGIHVASTHEIPKLTVSKIENKGQHNKRVHIIFSHNTSPPSLP